MNRVRDFQRKRAYRFERQFLSPFKGGNPFVGLSLEALGNATYHVWMAERDRYGLSHVAAPMASSHAMLVASCYCREHKVATEYLGQGLYRRFDPPKIIPHHIKYSIIADLGVVLHEVTHGLTHDMCAHGPEFLGALIGVYVRHGGADLSVCEKVKAAGVRVDTRWIEGRP